MNLFHELRTRRVPQFTISYIVGGFGLVQFLELLEKRAALSPHLVNLVGLALILLLPSVIVLAWSLGRPGPDKLGRLQKFAIPANVLAATLLLVIFFGGKELGAVTRTIEVEDEHGEVTERVIPTNAFRKRIIVFYPECDRPDDDPAIREATALLLAGDISQDVFLDVALPFNITNTLRDAGHEDGLDLPRALMRQIAVDGHWSHYCSGSVNRKDDAWIVKFELHDAQSGRRTSKMEFEGPDLFELVDQASVRIRTDLGVPASHLESAVDLPVAEVTSADLDAVRAHVAALVRVSHFNDWAGAAPLLEEAVGLDPDYALAQFVLFGVYQTLGQAEASNVAMAAAMDNLYRVTERTRYLIKSQYYFNVEQDMDKSLAVLEMWHRIFPSDIDALTQLALYKFIRQDIEGAALAYETILEIDPTQYRFLDDLADLYRQLGDHDRAEASLQRYIDLFPSRADGYDDLAGFYAKTGRLDESREALEQALLLEPGEQHLRLQIVDLDLKLGRYAEVAAAIERELEKAEGPRDVAQVHARRMLLGVQRGRPDQVADALAVFHANMAQVQNPLQLDIIYSLMTPLLTQTGRPDQALELLDAAAERIPAPFTDLTGVGRAWALVALGRTDEATAALAQATAVVETYSFETFRSSLALVGGLIARQEGDLEAATALFREAIELAPQDDPYNHVMLARALREAGDLKGAAKALEDALRMHPAHAEGNLEMARVEVDRGNVEAAKERLGVALGAWGKALGGYGPAAEAREILGRLNNGI